MGVKSSCNDPRKCREVQVPALTCEELLQKYGVPVYLKIDIEGQDRNCVRSLATSRCPHELPRFISYEDSARQSIGINHLISLGYTKFKFVKQFPWYGQKVMAIEKNWTKPGNVTFPYMSSGPFANLAWDGHVGLSWHDVRYETPKELALDTSKNQRPLGGWCDVHAWLFNPEPRRGCPDVGLER